MIGYRRQGSGPGTVLVHGGFVDSRVWTGLIDVLATSRTVVAPDRRGHGDSAPYQPGHQFAHDVDDLVDIVNDLAQEVGDVELVAHSAGAHVALAAAVAGTPAVRLVLWEPPDFRVNPVTAEVYRRLDEAAARGDRKALLRLLLKDVVAEPPGPRVSRSASPMSFRSPAAQITLANALAIPTGLRAFEAWDWSTKDLSVIAMPVHFLVGSDSPPFNRRFADQVAGRIPHADIQVIDGAHHATPTDDPDLFARVLADLRFAELPDPKD